MIFVFLLWKHPRWQKHQFLKNIQYMSRIDINTSKSVQNSWFSCFDDFSVRDSWKISRKLWTSLRLFVEKKYLRSRRATRAWTKTSNYQKHSLYTQKLTQNHRNLTKISDFHILMISVWETHGRSQENFEQVSDCLSRKNIWDPAERLVLGQKYQIIKNVQYMPRIDTKYTDFWQN